MKKLFCILLFLSPVIAFAQWNIVDTAAITDYSSGYNPQKYFCLIDDGSFAYYFTVESPYPDYPNSISVNKTTDDGKTWTNIIDFDGYSYLAYQLCFPDRDTGYFTYNFMSEREMQKTTDGGLNWTNITYNGLAAIYFINGSTGYGFRDNVLIRYDHDSLLTIDTLNLINQYPMQLCFTKNHIGYLICSNLPATQWTLLRTLDDGQNWSTSLTDSTTFIDFCAPSDSVCYVACDSGVVFKTKDAGNSWTKINLGTSDNINSVSFINADTGFALSFTGKVYKTVTGGASWKMTQIPGDMVTDLIKMITDSVAYIQAVSNYNQYAYYIILKTTTGGDLGSEEIKQDNCNIKLIPNPTKDKCKVQCAECNIKNIQIFNLTGEKVYDADFSSGTGDSVEVSFDLPAGVYFVKVTDENGMSVQKLVVE